MDSDKLTNPLKAERNRLDNFYSGNFFVYQFSNNVSTLLLYKIYIV